MNPFEFHTGITFEKQGSQHVGTCPFCEKKDKFHFNEDNLWDCKNSLCVEPETRMMRSGNLITFLRQLYAEFDTVTKASQVVGEWRGLPQTRISALGLKYNRWNGSIIIPTYRNGKLSNLYKAVEQSGKQRILCTPSVDHTLFNWPEETEDIIWVCEGHWDRVAAETIAPPGKGVTPIAVPGSGVWKKAWTDILAGKHVVFLYDNDQSGRVGFEKVIMKHIATSPQKPKSVNYLKWGEDTPPKFDLNDLYKRERTKARDWIEERIVEYKTNAETVIVKTDVDTVQPNKEIDTFDKLMTEFKKLYHTTPDMEMALLAVLTAIYSLKVGGEQLWYRIIGPAGCGKSTIANAVAASESVVLRSTFTGLFSGWADDSEADAGLIPTIAGKALIVKDADTLMQQQNIAKIFSELRDFYDKNSSVQFGNRRQYDYKNIRSSMILCGTSVLRRADQTFLGERFLDLEMKMTKTDEALVKQKVLENSIRQALDPSNLPPETGVQAGTAGFLEHLIDRPMDHHITVDYQKEIVRLASLAALLRTKVDRDAFGKGEITFQPTPELPTRLIGQLIKLAVCVPIVTQDKNEVRSKQLTRKTVRDIINPTSNRYRICMDLQEGWLDRNELVGTTGLAKSTLNRELDDLLELKLLDERKKPSNIPKHHRRLFTLKEEIKDGLMLINNNNG